MGSRRRARECALQILYQLEAIAEAEAPRPQKRGHKKAVTGALITEPERVQDAIEGFFGSFEAPGNPQEFASQLVQGVTQDIESIDAAISEASARWKLERLAMVDRNVLRLCIHELRHHHDIPPKVIINEGIEIARRFGSEESAAFVNGVLDSIRSRVRGGDGA